MGLSKRKSSEINLSLTVATYVAGGSVSKMNEVNIEVDLISPAVSTMTETDEKLKRIIFDLSGEQFLLNHKEHVAKAYVMPNYKGDVIFVKDNIAHSYCHATLAMDGAGNTRAYSHHIRGNQHSLIVYSLLIMKSIIVISCQTSCQRCARQLTKYMCDQNVKMNMIQFVSINHPGTCYRNTSIGPAYAEEFACVEAADRLLVDTSGNYLPDDQAIFAERLVTDGNTRGSLKFIAKQNELIGGVNDRIASSPLLFLFSSGEKVFPLVPLVL